MILVTGASGNVGGALARLLVGRGVPVRVMSRDPARVAGLGAAECVAADLDAPATLAKAVEGVERAFLVTMGYGPGQDQAFVAAAERAGVKQVVRLSTLEATDAVLTIGRWHREKDEVLERSGLAWTLLRPGMFMSNALHWRASLQGAGGVFFPGGHGPVAPIAPEDVARVAAHVLTTPGHAGQRYVLTGPELTSTAHMVETLGHALGRRLRYQDVPVFLARFFMRRNGMDARLAQAMGELALSLRRGEQGTQTATLTELLGDAGLSFAQWCALHAAEFAAAG